MSALPPCSTSVFNATRSLIDDMIEAVDSYCALPEGRAPCTLLVYSRWLEVGADAVAHRALTWCTMQGQPARVKGLRTMIEEWQSRDPKGPPVSLKRVRMEIDVDKRRG